MDISNFDLLELQTSYLQQDSTIQALCAALTPYLEDINNSIKLAYLYGRIDELNENIIDQLAWQFHVDFYESSLPLNTKRQLIKNSYRWHKIKGTPQATEELTKTIFGGDSEVVEWFQYDGEPYTFRVFVNIVALKDGLKTFYKMLDTIKNKRSHLDSVIGVISNEIELKTQYKDHLYPFFMCGTFQCGTKPDISNLASEAATRLKSEINNTDIKQKYNMAGTFSIGGDTN
jgi:phage tail P2-like protein